MSSSSWWTRRCRSWAQYSPSCCSPVGCSRKRTDDRTSTCGNLCGQVLFAPYPIAAQAVGWIAEMKVARISANASACTGHGGTSLGSLFYFVRYKYVFHGRTSLNSRRSGYRNNDTKNQEHAELGRLSCSISEFGTFVEINALRYGKIGTRDAVGGRRICAHAKNRWNITWAFV